MEDLQKEFKEKFGLPKESDMFRWITKNFLSGYEVQRLIAIERYKAVSQELDKVATHCLICDDNGLHQNDSSGNRSANVPVTKCDCMKVVNSRFNIRKILMNLQIEAFKKTGEPKKHQIEVLVEGGSVVAVENIPADVVVEVRDFDDDEDIPKTKQIDYKTAKKDSGGYWYAFKRFERDSK